MELESRQRARAYWRADGIPFLLGGFIYLAFLGAFCAIWFSVDHSYFKGNRNWFLESFIGPILGLAVMTMPFWSFAGALWVIGNWEELVEWFKVRVTYPRTGYVTPPSYWPGDYDQKSDPIAGPHPGWAFHILSILSGFWFWAFVQMWKGCPPDWVLLIALLAIRVFRYTIYPEHTHLSYGVSRIKAPLKEVLNSFWIWCWSAGLLSRITSGMPRIIKWGASIALTIFAVRIIYELASITLLNVGLCLMLCSLLFWKGTTATITLGFFVPGIYVAFIGAFRLVRYLQANPYPQS